jgi:hypothetical protein
MEVVLVVMLIEWPLFLILALYLDQVHKGKRSPFLVHHKVLMIKLES